MKFPLTMTVLSLFMSLAPAAPVPKYLMPEPVLYFPTKVGAKWEYKPGPNEWIGLVTKVQEKKDGTRIVTTQHWRKPGVDEDAFFQTMAVSRNGLFRIDTDLDEENPPECLLQLPATRGSRWVNSGPDGPRSRRKTVGEEVVKVPAGTFRAIRVEAEVWIAAGLSGTVTEWYSPNVGLIKRTQASSITHSLLSFTPGKD